MFQTFVGFCSLGMYQYQYPESVLAVSEPKGEIRLKLGSGRIFYSIVVSIFHVPQTQMLDSGLVLTLKYGNCQKILCDQRSNAQSTQECSKCFTPGCADGRGLKPCVGNPRIFKIGFHQQKLSSLSITCHFKLEGALYSVFCAEASKRPWTSLNE